MPKAQTSDQNHAFRPGERLKEHILWKNLDLGTILRLLRGRHRARVGLGGSGGGGVVGLGVVLLGVVLLGGVVGLGSDGALQRGVVGLGSGLGSDGALLLLRGLGGSQLRVLVSGDGALDLLRGLDGHLPRDLDGAGLHHSLEGILHDGAGALDGPGDGLVHGAGHVDDLGLHDGAGHLDGARLLLGDNLGDLDLDGDEDGTGHVAGVGLRDGAGNVDLDHLVLHDGLGHLEK